MVKIKKNVGKIRWLAKLPRAFDNLKKVGVRHQKQTQKLSAVKTLNNC